MNVASAVNPLRVAVVDVLRTLDAVQGPGGPETAHVYHDGEVPRLRGPNNTVVSPLPRIVYGSAFQTPEGASRYGQVGLAGSVFIRCWAGDSWDAEELFAAVFAALHLQPLALDGGVKWVKGLMVRIEDFKDPDVEAHVVVGRYGTETRVL